MPRIRTLITKETPLEMMGRLTRRMGLEKSWAKILHFLSHFLPGDCPEIEIVAIDCVPGAKNRLKIYFRTDILSYSHMEYFLTLGGAITDITAALHKAKVLWKAMTQGGDDASPTQAPYFRSGLVYYELKYGDDTPSSKAYLPLRRYLSSDLEASRGVERLVANLPGCAVPDNYPDFIQSIL